MSPRRFWSVERSAVGTHEGYFRGGSRQMRTHGRTHTPIHGGEGVRCDIGCAPATRKRSLREDSGAGSLRITAEIPFGSLAADNKVPQLRDDATYRLTPQEHAPHVYSHASPGSRERMPRSRLRELWAAPWAELIRPALHPTFWPGSSDPLHLCHLLSPPICLAAPLVPDTYVARARELRVVTSVIR